MELCVKRKGVGVVAELYVYIAEEIVLSCCDEVLLKVPNLLQICWRRFSVSVARDLSSWMRIGRLLPDRGTRMVPVL